VVIGPWLPPLLSAEALSDVLGDEGLRVFDATVFLRRAVDGGPYAVESGRSSYEREHIPGAAFADLPAELSDTGSQFPFTVPDAASFASAVGRLGVDGDSWVIAYAQESPMWATRLWWLFRYFGHDKVSVLDGGLVAWKAMGGPVESGSCRYQKATFTAHRRPERLVSLDEVKSVVSGGQSCLLNALSPDAFRGEGPGAYSRPGRIPGSVNVPWSHLVDPTTQRFLPAGQLSDAFAGSGVTDDQPVVAYCGGGISATVDLFALELTGRHDGRLYDGSLTEWSAHPELPLVTG
jgi:thiosulfate/3-mercaptopyruvate sulfurtransferase